MHKIIHFPSSQLPIRLAKIKLTKELCENPREETQVARNIVSHGRWQRLNNSVYAEYSLKKLYKNERMKLQLNEVHVNFLNRSTMKQNISRP